MAASPANKGDTIFSMIIKGDIKTEFLYEDDKCVSFKDIQPMAPVHCLVVPRKPIETLGQAQDEDAALLGHLLLVAKRVAKEQKLDDGFRIVINTGKDATMAVPHLHIHIMGGRPLGWPAG